MKPSILLRMGSTAAVIATGAAGAITTYGSMLATSGLSSCLTVESYVYSAQKYDRSRDCLMTSAPVEVVSGAGASSTCPAECLTVGNSVYLSTMCPPLPIIATALAADAGDCIAALAALVRGATCDAPGDGGGADGDPEVTPDAGSVGDGFDGAPPEQEAGDAAEAG